MDKFFACVGCLMSNNLRNVVYSSVEEFARFFEIYRQGNDFEGQFERNVPVRPQPIILTVVSPL